MKTKILGIVLVLLLVSPLLTQNKEIHEAVIYGPWSEELPLAQSQLLKGEKVGVMLSSAFVLADPDINSEDPLSMNWVVYTKAKDLYFYCNYTAQYNTKVRFRLMITGPQFFTWTSDWYDIKYKTNYLYYLWGAKAKILKKTGNYKLVIVAEQNGIGGGSECVSTCTFKVL